MNNYKCNSIFWIFILTYIIIFNNEKITNKIWEILIDKPAYIIYNKFYFKNTEKNKMKKYNNIENWEEDFFNIKKNSFKQEINYNNENKNNDIIIDKKKYEEIKIPIMIFWGTTWLLTFIFLILASVISISEIHNKYWWVFIIPILLGIIWFFINKQNKLKEILIDKPALEQYKKLYFKDIEKKYNNIKFKASNFSSKIKYIYPTLKKRWIYVYHYIDSKEFFKATLNYPILLKFFISLIWVIISLIIAILNILIYILLSLPFIIFVWFLLWWAYYVWRTENPSNIFLNIIFTVILLLPITYYITIKLFIPYIKATFNIIKNSTSIQWSKNFLKSQLANFTWTFEILKLYINWNNLVFLETWILFPKTFYYYNSPKLIKLIWKYEYYFQEKLFEKNKLSDKKTNIIHHINFLLNYIVILLTNIYQKLFPNFGQKLYNLTSQLWENNNKINSIYSELEKNLDDFISWNIFNLEKEISKKLPLILKYIKQNIKIINKIQNLIEDNEFLERFFNIKKFNNYQRQKFNNIIDKFIQLLQKYINLTNSSLQKLNKLDNNWQIKLRKITIQELNKNLKNNIVLFEKMKI